MIEHVLAIDPSLRSTGLARLTYDGHRCELSTSVATSEGRATATVSETTERIRRLGVRIVPRRTDSAPGPVLVIIEGHPMGVTEPYTWERAGLWWRIAALCQHYCYPLAVCNPATLKKWASDNGRASKDEMRQALNDLWPGVMARLSDQVDAGLLAIMAGQYLRWPVGGQPLRQSPSLVKVAWPKLENRDASV